MALAKSQQSLKKWSAEKWKTSDGKLSKGKKRYLPEKAWASLTPAEKAATNKAKAAGKYLFLPFDGLPSEVFHFCALQFFKDC